MIRPFRISAITAPVLALAMLMLPLAACQNAIFDSEGDCDPVYRVHLSYTRNVKWADALPAEVTHLSLYAFNPQGARVWSTTLSIDQLRDADYYVNLPLDPGTYDIVSWCGGASAESAAARWSLDGGESVTSTADLTCRLATTRAADGSHLSSTDLHRLYHGSLLNLALPDSYGVHDYEIDLTKDTNMMRVVLQHADGEPLDQRYFTFSITDANTALDHTNAIASRDPITYTPWAVSLASAETAPSKADGGITSVTSLIAEMTTSRLVVSNRPMLTINYTAPGDEHLVAQLPLIDYFLMTKGSVNRDISDQEFLDRQDDYILMFILDDNNRWYLHTGLIINGWRIVRYPANLS